MIGRTLGGAFALLVLAAVAADGKEPTADFYAGKTIEIVVGTAPESTDFSFARLVGHHIVRYISSNPTVEIKAMPGDGGRKAAQWLYQFAPADGSVIGAVDPGALLDPLIGADETRKAIKYDPRRFQYLGSASRSVQVCIVRKDSPAHSFEETRRQTLIMGASRAGGPTRETALALMNVLGARFRMVEGYRDTRQTLRALEEGEVQGICGFDFDMLMTMRPDLVDDSKVDILLQYALSGHPELIRRDVPMIWSFIRNDTDKRVLELLTSRLVFDKPYVFPPGVPHDRVGALRSALERTLKDPDFRADARKSGLAIMATPGRRIESLIKKVFSAPKDVVQRARAAREG